MMRLLWSFWRHHKERFIITLLGVFIISSGLSILFGLSESNKGTVMETLQNRWKVSYHILVSPSGTSITDEKNGLMEPNLPGGITGGITLEQLQRIKNIPEIDVAAPLAVIGYSRVDFNLAERAELSKKGIYRRSIKINSNNGVEDQVTTLLSDYVTYGAWQSSDTSQQYGVHNLNGNLVDQYAYDYTLIAGVDPIEENKLVGLEQAVIPFPNGDNWYFDGSDSSQVRILDNSYFGSNKIIELPILVSNQLLANKTFSYQYDRLDLPFDTEEQATATMEEVKRGGLIHYLDQVKTDFSQVYTFPSEQVAPQLFASLTNTGDSPGLLLSQKATPLSFNVVPSPYLERWSYAYHLEQHEEIDFSISSQFPEFYRPYEKLEDPDHPNAATAFVLFPKYIGMYDPTKLNISKDIENLFPMDTYSTPAAKYVIDDEGRPVNPQLSVSSINNPLGLMTSPPTMLTTLEAASLIIGDKPISVIRVKVDGVDEITEANRHKLEQIAAMIREQTGLSTDITFASSPQTVLIHIPKSGTQTALGWIEQQWFKLGDTYTLVNEVTVGFSGMLLLVVIVAIIYVLTTNLVSFLIRKKQFAVLLSIGWRHSQLNRLLVTEALVIGTFVALVTWSMEAYFIFFSNLEISLARFLIMGLSGFFIYLLGVIFPIILIKRITPMDALKTGETVAVARHLIPINHLFLLAVSNFVRMIKRNMLSVFSMMTPTVLLMFFVFVTFRLKGTFYTSWLGQYAAAEIGPMHYAAIMVCIIISVLTTAEIMWQNVSDRKSEISLLKAIGWRSRSILKLVLWEGIISSCFASIVALILGSLFITVLYHQFPAHELWYLVLVALTPIFSGTLGSLIPAYLATLEKPLKGITKSTSTSKLVKKLLMIGLTVLIILVSLITIISFKHILTSDSVTSTNEDDTANSKVSSSIVQEPPKVGDLSEFSPEYIVSGSQSEYDIELQMNKEGQFTAKATIKVSNSSTDSWDKLIFYMIPNVFTIEGHPQTYREDARLDLKEVLIDGQSNPYTLEWDTLSIPVAEGLPPSAQTEVVVTYEFTVPEKGIRQSKTGQTYDLAEWYPMLATYSKGWNKQPYRSEIESYHTDFSDFSLKYELPEGYRLISSSDKDSMEPVSSGQIDVQRVKELMVIVSKDMKFITKIVDDVEIRVWGVDKEKDKFEEISQIAAEALTFFSKNIAPYPHKQLDIIVGDRLSMEYPGLITIHSKEDVKHTVVHEIAHQWFYGMVSNDPYYDGWLDEGMTELSTSLYMNDYSFAEQYSRMKKNYSNLPISEFGPGEIAPSLYAQPVMKFKELFESYGTEGIDFLRAYFEIYKYKQVNTEEFIKFVQAYFHMKDNLFFEDWIKIGND